MTASDILENGEKDVTGFRHQFRWAQIQCLPIDGDDCSDGQRPLSPGQQGDAEDTYD